MRLVLFTRTSEGARVGALTDGGVVDLSGFFPPQATGQATMQSAIDAFETHRAAAETELREQNVIPLEELSLLPPLPRPGKILCCIGNYWEHAKRDPVPLNMYLKNPDAVIGPDATIELPEFTEPWIFMHEAELGLVIKGPSKRIPQASWREAVFGYTCFVDVSAREKGRYTWRSGSWMGKSFDTFAPLGPCIITADEIPDPNQLHVRFWNDGQLRHDYNTDDMEHQVPELVEFATTIMTMNSGDIIACGTNHEGLGPLQDGENVEIEITGIGRMALSVRDPLKRSWEKGVYMGADSTNHEAKRLHHDAARS